MYQFFYYTNTLRVLFKVNQRKKKLAVVIFVFYAVALTWRYSVVSSGGGEEGGSRSRVVLHN